MDTTKAALLFFYGIFWATTFGSVTKFRPFDTAEWFRKGGAGKAIPRFFVGLILADALPIYWLWVLYTSDAIIPGDQAGPVGIFSAAIAALSVFSVPRLTHAILATPKTFRCFYTESDWLAVVKDARGKVTDSFWAHFIPGALYVVVFPSIACLLAKVVGS